MAENILRGQVPPVNKHHMLYVNKHHMLYVNYTELTEVLQTENKI